MKKLLAIITISLVVSIGIYHYTTITQSQSVTINEAAPLAPEAPPRSALEQQMLDEAAQTVPLDGQAEGRILSLSK